MICIYCIFTYIYIKIIYIYIYIHWGLFHNVVEEYLFTHRAGFFIEWHSEFYVTLLKSWNPIKITYPLVCTKNKDGKIMLFMGTLALRWLCSLVFVCLPGWLLLMVTLWSTNRTMANHHFRWKNRLWFSWLLS